MLKPDQRIAIYMEGFLDDPDGKMGHSMIRYAPNPVVAVIDSRFAGKTVLDVIQLPRNCPIVTNVKEARALGAEVLLLGTTPTGGLIPPECLAEVERALQLGMCVINGLHDRLGPRFPQLRPGQWIWDIRQEPKGVKTGACRARRLPNKRVVMLGTGMCIGKMTAGIEIWKAARARGIRAEFLATGQCGIAIMGKGVPLDAVRLDYACGVIEQLVLSVADAELILVEGQGAITHPASSATLPLIRGTCPTHLILCHRAGMTHLDAHPWVKLPPLSRLARLYEDIAEACGAFARPVTAGVSLNTGDLDEAAARQAVQEAEQETGLPATDPVRFGAEKLLAALGF